MSIFARRPTFFALAGLWLALVIPAAAQAAVAHDGASPGEVSLDQPAYTAHENQGYLTITIQRTGDLSGAEHVGYGVKRQDAQPGIDFDTIANHYVVFAPGPEHVHVQRPHHRPGHERDPGARARLPLQLVARQPRPQ